MSVMFIWTCLGQRGRVLPNGEKVRGLTDGDLNDIRMLSHWDREVKIQAQSCSVERLLLPFRDDLRRSSFNLNRYANLAHRLLGHLAFLAGSRALPAEAECVAA